MKLRYAAASPYARKVAVMALETGLDAGIERIPTNTTDPASDLAKDNPLGKVPTLMTEDGEPLYDSPVICEYLDSLHDRPKLFPPTGPARWRALRLQALGDGIMDAALLVMIETRRRPEALRWAGWVELQQGKIRRALDQLEREADGLEGPLTIGQVTVGCALGYLDLRFADEAWRDDRPKLAAWFEDFGRRPSMQATRPGEGA